MSMRLIAGVFMGLQLLDVLLTAHGISLQGTGYEKNAFMRELIIAYGFWSVAALKLAAGALIAAGLVWMEARLTRKGRVLRVFGALLCLIPLYGAGSSLWVLL